MRRHYNFANATRNPYVRARIGVPMPGPRTIGYPDPLAGTRTSPAVQFRQDAATEAAVNVITQAENCSVGEACKRALVAYARRLGARDYAAELERVRARRLKAG